MWWIIIGAAMAMIVLVILIVFFADSIGQGGKSISGNIAGTQDCDKDLVANLFDKCPCDAAQQENEEFEGCPSDVKDKAGLAKYNDKNICDPPKGCIG